MRGHMLEFSQAPTGVRPDSNEFGVVRVVEVVVFVEIACVIWIVRRDHRLISFVNGDRKNELIINNEVNQ